VKSFYLSIGCNKKDIKALFASWILEGRGREGKAYGEVNFCLGVLKK